MAINKSVENEFGVDFTYHKIREVRVINDDKIGVQLVMTVQSWLNKQARINGKEPVIQQCIIEQADFAMTPFYALLKAKFPDYSDGDDDFDNSFKKVPQGDVQFFTQTRFGKLLDHWKEKTEDAEATEINDKPEAEQPADDENLEAENDNNSAAE